MHPVAAALWGGFFTVAAFMLAASIVSAARGFSRVAAAGATYSLVPTLFVCAYLGLLPLGDQPTQTRFLTHLTVLGSMGLTSQLLLVLRGYRKPLSSQPLQLGLLASAAAVLAISWMLPPRWSLWLATAYGMALGLGLIALALRKALRGTRVAWISAAGVTLALTSLGALDWIAFRGSAAPSAAHAVAALSSMAYVSIMGWTMWMRHAYALELKQVLAQGPSFDPVTRLPSHAHAGRLVNSFLRGGPAHSLGVVAVSLANLGTLEALHGRAAYNHALYVCAGRLRRCAPLGAQLGRLGEDGFLVLVRTEDVALLKHIAGKVRRALTQPVHMGADLGPDEADALPRKWVADIGIGMALRTGPDGAASAVATARSMSRAAHAASSRIVLSERRDAPHEEVEVGV